MCKVWLADHTLILVSRSLTSRWFSLRVSSLPLSTPTSLSTSAHRLVLSCRSDVTSSRGQNDHHEEICCRVLNFVSKSRARSWTCTCTCMYFYGGLKHVRVVCVVLSILVFFVSEINRLGRLICCTYLLRRKLMVLFINANWPNKVWYVNRRA